jgi:uncharacterized repeat protein (TIGR01451 family)
MKRMIVRLSALTAVISLGTFAVVEAQRSARSAADETVSTGEPAELNVDERTVKPLPPPTDRYADNDRYAPADRIAQVDEAAANAGGAPVSDPFAAAHAASHNRDLAGDASDPPAPLPEDPQGIPHAAEAMGRYSQSATARRAMWPHGDVRALAYEDAAAPTAAQSPDDVTGDGLAASGGQPTLAPPRPEDRYAPPDIDLPADGTAAPLVAEAEDRAPLRQPPADVAPPAQTFDRGQALPRGREPGLLPADSFDERPSLPAAAADNFAPPADRVRPGVPAEGVGRPGGKHLDGPQAPTLTLEKIAPPEIQVGKPAVFELKIRNVGPVPAANVEVHDQIPKGTQLISTTPRATEAAPGEVVWSLGALRPGEETSVELELMPVAEGEVGSVATVHFAAESSVRTIATKPVLALEIKAPHEVLLGEDLTMAIKLSNRGTGAATGVTLREVVPEMLQHQAGPELENEVGVLKPGETREFDLTMRAVKAGRVLNTLTALGEGSLRVDQQVDIEVIAAQLAVKMDGPSRRYLDRQANYTISVSNPGTATAKEISLVTHLPAGLRFVEANNAGQYDQQTRSVAWLLEELPPGETGSVTLTTVPVETGEQVVRIEGTAERGLTAHEEKAIMVDGVAAIFFEVVDVADPIEVGGETAYEVRVVNQGTKAATNVQVVGLLPEELTPTGADGPARYAIDGQRVLFEPLAQLAPKADTTYRIKARGRGPGDVRVRVQVVTDEIRAPITKEESTRVYADE